MWIETQGGAEKRKVPPAQREWKYQLRREDQFLVTCIAMSFLLHPFISNFMRDSNQSSEIGDISQKKKRKIQKSVEKCMGG